MAYPWSWKTMENTFFYPKILENSLKYIPESKLFVMYADLNKWETASALPFPAGFICIKSNKGD